MNTPTAIRRKENRQKHRAHKKAAGFTLFIALIVSSLLLAIGFSLSTIILKQLVFANSGKESQLAFYAADSGAECALYWDRKDFNGFTTFDSTFGTTSVYEEIFCGGGGKTNPPIPQSGRVGSFSKVSADLTQATTTFYVDYSDPENENHKACAKVLVYKWLDTSGANPIERTQIDSRGYNVPLNNGVTGPGGNAICDFAGSNRVVERAIRLDY